MGMGKKGEGKKGKKKSEERGGMETGKNINLKKNNNNITCQAINLVPILKKSNHIKQNIYHKLKRDPKKSNQVFSSYQIKFLTYLPPPNYL